MSLDPSTVVQGLSITSKGRGDLKAGRWGGGTLPIEELILVSPSELVRVSVRGPVLPVW